MNTESTTTMELTQEETRLILADRKKKALAKRQLATGHLIIKIAYEWSLYAEETREGLTYTTFCNTFELDGFLPNEYQGYRKPLYDAVTAVLAAIDEPATQIADAIESA